MTCLNCGHIKMILRAGRSLTKKEFEIRDKKRKKKKKKKIIVF